MQIFKRGGEGWHVAGFKKKVTDIHLQLYDDTIDHCTLPVAEVLDISPEILDEGSQNKVVDN